MGMYYVRGTCGESPKSISGITMWEMQDLKDTFGNYTSELASGVGYYI
jgi:hypothetical protein